MPAAQELLKEFEAPQYFASLAHSLLLLAYLTVQHFRPFLVD